MFENLTIDKKDEFFIAVAKQGIHSFLMLGVMKKDGAPQLLARVGKTNDIDPYFGHNVIMIPKVIGGGTLSRLFDEGIFRSSTSTVDVSYQAYALNFEQFKDCLGLINDIEKKQFENSVIKAAIQAQVSADDDQKIRCYVPIDETDENDTVTLAYKPISECDFVTPEDKEVARSAVTMGTQQIQLSNTCRTTSINIIEVILGFKTEISRYFFIAPSYKTKLIAGQPDAATFYILPAPPKAIQNLTGSQASMLEKLYKRLEDIPKSNPGDEATRKKFDKINDMYKKIAGDNTLDANALLITILEYEQSSKHILFHKRAPNFFSRWFSLATSTEKVFNAIKNELKQEVVIKKKPDDVLENDPTPTTLTNAK